MFYSVMGATVGVVAAHIAGFFFGRNKAEDVDLELISPCIRRFQKSNYLSVKLDETILKSSNEKS